MYNIKIVMICPLSDENSLSMNHWDCCWNCVVSEQHVRRLVPSKAVLVVLIVGLQPDSPSPEVWKYLLGHMEQITKKTCKQRIFSKVIKQVFLLLLVWLLFEMLPLSISISYLYQGSYTFSKAKFKTFYNFFKVQEEFSKSILNGR